MKVSRRSMLLGVAAGIALAGCKRNKEGELAEVVNVADPGLAPQLLRGFHPIEQNAWRWAQSKFAVALKPPKQSSNGAILVLRYSMPEAALAKVKQTTIKASVEGIPLAPETCDKTGLLEMRREVPAEALKGKTGVTVEFSVEPFMAPGDLDQRELSLIVHSVGLVKKA